MSIQEGQTATNPKTGQKVVFRGGQWVNSGAGPAAKPPAMQKRALAQKDNLADLVSPGRQLNDLERIYNKNFKGVGVGSLLEYLPTPARSQFDSAANGMRPLLKPLIRGPGEGAWSDKDQELLDSMIPSGSVQDSGNEQRLKQMRALLEDKRAKNGANAGWSVREIK